MKIQIKKYLSLIIWVMVLITIGGGIGSLTKAEISTWYIVLNRSNLTPPNYVFPIAWTILYGIIGACGWLIWDKALLPTPSLLKALYLTQLMLNWSWTPLFFHYHLTGLAMIVLGTMDILVCALIGVASRKIKMVALLMLPYLAWIVFATYLNFYIWQYN